jgi:hypothetical protein
MVDLEMVLAVPARRSVESVETEADTGLSVVGATWLPLVLLRSTSV